MASRKIIHCVKKLQLAWPLLKADFEKTFPGWKMKLTATHRPVEEQWELYKKGRELNPKTKRYRLVDKSKRVTNIDGKTRLSKHNVYPSKAFDIVLVTPQKDHTWDSNLPEYQYMIPLSHKFKLKSGGEWGWDYCHLEV